MNKKHRLPADGEILALIEQERPGQFRHQIVSMTLHDRHDGYRVLKSLRAFPTAAESKAHAESEYFVFYAQRYGFPHPADPAGQGCESLPDDVTVMSLEALHE